MKLYYTRQILNKEQLKIINDIILNANNKNLWIDGLSSGGGYHSIKKNQELSDIELSNSINNLIMNSLDQDQKFMDFCAPKSSNRNIISKMFSGCYYNPHADQWNNGDYSTTVFLNDPKEYVGGELCLYYGGENEHMFKLNAGWAITYPTGTLHRVNKVVTGNRYASVFWTKSLIQDPFIRFLYSEISNIKYNIKDDYSYHIKDCKNAEKDIKFCLENLQMDILRKYAQ